MVLLIFNTHPVCGRAGMIASEGPPPPCDGIGTAAGAGAAALTPMAANDGYRCDW